MKNKGENNFKELLVMETDLVARRKRYIACLEEAVKKVCTLSALPEVKN